MGLFKGLAKVLNQIEKKVGLCSTTSLKVGADVEDQISYSQNFIFFAPLNKTLKYIHMWSCTFLITFKLMNRLPVMQKRLCFSYSSYSPLLIQNA